RSQRSRGPVGGGLLGLSCRRPPTRTRRRALCVPEARRRWLRPRVRRAHVVSDGEIGPKQPKPARLVRCSSTSVGSSILRWRGPTADATDVKRAVYIEDLPPHVVSIKGVGRPFSRTWDKSNSLARSRRAGQGEVSIAERTRA